MKLKNPHDNFFKEIFEEKERAIELMQVTLPPEINSVLNYEVLHKEGDNFRDEDMKNFQSDVLFSLETKNGSKLKVYILFEHKSYIDANINLQLLSYLSRIYSKMEMLTPIIPIIFSHAKKKWSIPLEFLDEFKLSQDEKLMFSKYIPNFKSEIIDMQETDLKKIISSLTFKAILYTFKNIREFENLEKFKEFVLLSKDLFYEESGIKLIHKLLMYIYSVNDIEISKIKETVSQNISYKKGEEIMTTTAERLINEGLERGIHQGKLEGKLEGKKEEKLEIAISLLGLLDNNVIAEKTGLSLEEVESLERNLIKH